MAADTAGGGVLASDAASNVIAIIGVGIGTGVSLGALPNDYVTIAQISLSLAPQGEVYVGDRIVLTAQVEVSYGNVSEGSEGRIKVELIEDGTGTLKTIQRGGTTPKESFSLRYEARAINHGTKLYYVKVTVWGDDDIPFNIISDNYVSRDRQSETLSLDVKKPIEVTTTLVTPVVSHITTPARALMKVSNRSESTALVATKIRDTVGQIFRWLREREADVTYIDYLGSHLGNGHEEDQIFYFEPVKMIFHAHVITTPNGVVSYDQIAPDRETLYDPITIICAGQDNRTGLIIDDWQDGRLALLEVQYACLTVNETDAELVCSGVFTDMLGSSIKAKKIGKQLRFEGTLTGTVGMITLTPENALYRPYSFTVLLNKQYLKDLPDKFIFAVAPIPPIKGTVFIKSERLPVRGCLITLTNAQGKKVYETVSDENGRFTAYCNARNIDAGKAVTVTLTLPWSITYAWKNPNPLKTLSPKDLLNGTPLFFNVDVLPQEKQVTITGRAVVMKGSKKEILPVKGVEITIKNELNGIQFTTQTDAKGRYEIVITPGRYFAEVTNAVELGFKGLSKKLFRARTSRTGVDIQLSLTSPEISYSSSEVIHVKSQPSSQLTVSKKGEILKKYESRDGFFYIPASDFQDLKELRISIVKGNLISRPVEIQFSR